MENNDDLSIALETQKVDLEYMEKDLHILRVAIWKVELKSPPAMSLSRTYELQKDVFFAIMGFKMNKKVPKTSIEEMWQYVGNFENMRELVCEIIAYREMTVEDDFLFFP